MLPRTLKEFTLVPNQIEELSTEFKFKSEFKLHYPIEG